ncbi:MAG: choice-of-anchor J domain-containing protein [Flavobacterium sp.]
MKQFYLLFLLLSFTWSHAQFFEDFEGDIFPPSGWIISSNLVNPLAQWNSIDGTTALSGTKSAYMTRYNVGAGNTSEDWLITPPITVSEGFNLHFFSRTTLSGNQGTLYQIKVSTSTDSNDLSSFVLLQEYNETTLHPGSLESYAMHELSLETYENQTIRIAFVRVYFQYGFALGGDRWLLDNVVVDTDLPSGCAAPYSLSLGGSLHNSFTVQWLNGGYGQLYQTFITQNPDEIPSDELLFSGTVLRNRQFTNLNCNSTHYVYVRAKCHNDITSEWTGPIEVTTTACRIRMIAFMDLNYNGIKDANEPNFNLGSYQYEFNNSGNVMEGSSSFSFYDVFLDDDTTTLNLNFNIYPENSGTYVCNQSYSNITYNPQNFIFYFPVNVTNPPHFVSLNLFGVNPRPSSTYMNHITLKNLGAEPQSGTITYTKDPELNIHQVNVPATITPTGFTYNYTNLGPNETRHISVRFLIPEIPIVQLDQMLNSSVIATYINSSSTTSSNQRTITNRIVASYDPNDKNEDRGPQIHIDDFEVGNDLFYTIRFQNTGNANALTVRIEDVLDPQLNPATVRMIASSHNYTLTRNQNFLEWTFNDINLVPESVDELESIGYVYFKIKPFPGFTVGSIIPNTAAIYFDTNPPIITNTFQTEFVDQLSVPSLEATHFQIYPNPAKEMVYIQSTSSETLSSIRLFNMLGKEVLQLNNIHSTATQINLSGLPIGIYLMELTSESGTSSTQKVVKQ